MNRKINADELMLEVTQRCNMNCAHCLRGDARNVDMTKEIVDKALKDVEYIGCIIFTGGEPTLNIPIIKYTLDYCKEHRIDVNTFFIATNGKAVTLDFIALIIDWYAYIDKCGGECDMCEVALSTDNFHESIPQSNINLLSILSIFSSESKNSDFTKYALLNEGRARNLGPEWKKRDLSCYGFEGEVSDDTIFTQSIVYISANGDVKNNCDTAFDNDACTMGNLFEDDLNTILEKELDACEVA